MFNRLSKRIVLIFLIVVWVCTILMGLFAYRWSKQTYVSQYSGMSFNYFQSSNNRLTQFLHYTEETFKLIASHPSIVEAMSEPYFSLDASQLLSSLVFDSNLNVTEVKLYSASGFVYSFAKNLNTQPFELFKAAENVQAFLEDNDRKYIWTSRHQVSFNDSTEHNVFSYMLKLEENNDLLGLLVVDFEFQELYRFFVTANPLFNENKLLFVPSNSSFLNVENNLLSLLTDDEINRILHTSEVQTITTTNEKILLQSEIADSGAKIVILIPLREAIKLSSPKWILISFIMIYCICTFYIAILLRNSIIQPLNRLYGRINAWKK
ncbi:cache domain-containing protein [Paenibacillus eucommiae]|uniref:Uncharacterized protein n=1 Tax=Paenibacillus eucommiae TaxID=1355755 RepID=A0ABS4IRN9_9BACL|nr:cache domain-containing protein [Paenibacillus eucommiae]MBP1990237.1 hypothetical protein [Paenibacillus eucommiae]